MGEVLVGIFFFFAPWKAYFQEQVSHKWNASTTPAPPFPAVSLVAFLMVLLYLCSSKSVLKGLDIILSLKGSILLRTTIWPIIAACLPFSLRPSIKCAPYLANGSPALFRETERRSPAARKRSPLRKLSAHTLNGWRPVSPSLSGDKTDHAASYCGASLRFHRHLVFWVEYVLRVRECGVVVPGWEKSLLLTLVSLDVEIVGSCHVAVLRFAVLCCSVQYCNTTHRQRLPMVRTWLPYCEMFETLRKKYTRAPIMLNLLPRVLYIPWYSPNPRRYPPPLLQRYIFPCIYLYNINIIWQTICSTNIPRSMLLL